MRQNIHFDASIMLKQKREEFRVSIRRKQNEQLFSQKRKIAFKYQQTQNSVEFAQFILNLNDIQKFLKEQNYERILELVKKTISILLEDEQAINVNCKKFSMYQQEKLLILRENQIDHQLIHLIEHINPHDMQQLFKFMIELSVIIYSHDVFDEMSLLENELVMKQILIALKEYDFPSMQLVVYNLLYNLLCLNNNEQKGANIIRKKKLSDYGFPDILKELWIEGKVLLELETFRSLSDLFYVTFEDGNYWPIKDVKSILPIITAFFQIQDDQLILSALRTLSFLFQVDKVANELCHYIGFYDQLTQKLIFHLDDRIQSQACLRFLELSMVLFQQSFVIKQNDSDLDSFLLKNNYLGLIHQIFLMTQNRKIQKAVYWALSNLCTVPNFQQKILEHKTYKQLLLESLHSDEITYKREISYCLKFLSQSKQNQFLVNLLEMDENIEFLMNGLREIDQKTNENTRQAIYNLLLEFKENDTNFALEKFEMRDFITILKEMENSESEERANFSMGIQDQFYI